MKTKTTNKTARLLVCCALVIMLVCAVCVFASAEASAELSIGRTNLRYDDQTDIIVEVTGTVPEGSVAGIAVWSFEQTANRTPDELTIANVSYTNFTAETYQGVTFYATRGISAKDLGKELTVAPVIKTGDTIELAGEKVKKSLVGYVNERLTNDELEAYQINLYRGLVVYGSAAEKVLEGTNTNTVVLAKNGYVGGRMLPISIVDGETAMLRAGVQNADGKYFSHWEDSQGNFVSGQRLYTVSDLSAGLNEYVAVYDVQATSAFNYFADFQQFALGETKVTVGDLTDAQKTAGKANVLLPLFVNYQDAIRGIGKMITFDPAALEGLADTDEVPVTGSDSLNFKENFDGTKYLNYVKTAEGSSFGYASPNWVDTYYHPTLQGVYDRFEMDIQMKSAASAVTMYIRLNGTSYGRFVLTISRGTNSEGKDCFRVQYPTANGTKSLYFDDNGGKDVVTFAFDSTDATNIYFNGVKQTLEGAITRLDGASTDPFPAGTYNVTQVGFETNAGYAFDYNIYSYGLVDVDKIK